MTPCRATTLCIAVAVVVVVAAVPFAAGAASNQPTPWQDAEAVVRAQYERLAGERLIFMGDSVLRKQFSALIAQVRGRHMHILDRPSLASFHYMLRMNRNGSKEVLFTDSLKIYPDSGALYKEARQSPRGPDTFEAFFVTIRSVNWQFEKRTTTLTKELNATRVVLMALTIADMQEVCRDPKTAKPPTRMSGGWPESMTITVGAYQGCNDDRVTQGHGCPAVVPRMQWSNEDSRKWAVRTNTPLVNFSALCNFIRTPARQLPEIRTLDFVHYGCSVKSDGARSDLKLDQPMDKTKHAQHIDHIPQEPTCFDPVNRGLAISTMWHATHHRGGQASLELAVEEAATDLEAGMWQDRALQQQLVTYTGQVRRVGMRGLPARHGDTTVVVS